MKANKKAKISTMLLVVLAFLVLFALFILNSVITGLIILDLSNISVYNTSIDLEFKIGRAHV